ncbi:hypothetical protein MMC12_007891 [Toensbergia leucococca]|nr:hypothetical protein [Toensbergia leucococca]
MDENRLHPQLLPPNLYRCHYPTSWTKYSDATAFIAADSKTFLSNSQPHLFVKSIQTHLDWNSTIESPYVSTFAERDNAENWALRWRKNHHGQECRVYEINTRALGEDIYVFCMNDVRRNFKLPNPENKPENSEHLFLHRIPPTAIIRSRSTVEIDQERQMLRGSRGKSNDAAESSLELQVRRLKENDNKNKHPHAWAREPQSYRPFNTEIKGMNGENDLIKIAEGSQYVKPFLIVDADNDVEMIM